MTGSDQSRKVVRLLLLLAAAILPWVISVAVVRTTLAENDCLEFPWRVGLGVVALYGPIVGGISFVKHASVWRAVAWCVATWVLLVVLGQVLLANLLGASDRGPQKRTMAQLAEIAREVQAFREREGHFPATLDTVGVRDIWDGWGQELQYVIRGDSYAIRSAGACGVFEQATSWDYPNEATDRYTADMVIVDGEFVAWPEGVQR